MRLVNWVAALVLVSGLILIADFFSRSVNPDVTAGDFGLLGLLLGTLIFVAGVVQRKSGPLYWNSRSMTGWVVLAGGLIVAFAAFLLENQVACSCPAYGPCECGLLLHDALFYGGVVFSLGGLALLLLARLPYWKADVGHG